MTALEPRRLLAAVAWDGGGDGVNWIDANNWSTNALPQPADDVTIDVPANPTVLLASGTQSIRSLVTNEALRVTGGTLAVSTTADVNNTLTVGGGTISGGAYDVLGGSLVSSPSGGLLNNVAVTGDLLLNAANAYVELGGTTTFGVARLSASNTSVRLRPGYVLSNAVVAEGAATGDRYVYVTSGGAGTATISSTGSVRLLATSGGDLNIANLSAGTLVNNGLISAEAAGRNLSITNSVLTNNGMLAATAGTLDIRPTNWTNTGGTITGSGSAAINLGGTLDATGGIGTLNTSTALVNITGAINNGGATIALTGTTGSPRLAGGAINGGAISVAGGASVVGTSGGGLLNGVAVGGDVTLTLANAYVELGGNTTFATGRLAGSNTSFRLRPGYVLSSTIVAEGLTAGDRYVYVTSVGAGTATIAPGGVIRLAVGTGGDLNIANLSAGTLVNNGLISAEAGGHNLTITNSLLTNNGTLAATSGLLDIRPTNWSNATGVVNGSGGASINIGGTLDATGGIGTFNTSAAIVSVTGTINNAGNAIALTATTGSFRLAGGTINNGAVSVAGGASLVGTSIGGLLNSLALGGDLLLNVANAYVELGGTTTFAAARLSASNTSVRLRPGYVLSNAVVAEGAAAGDRYVYVTSGGAGTATIATGGSIRLLASSGGDLNIANLSAGTLVNNGLISAEAASRNLTITNSVLTNNGTLAAPAGTLDMRPTNWTNGTGTVNGSGGATINLGGTLDATSGIGTFNTSAAIVNITGTINNAGNTIALTATTGSFRMAGGTINNGSVSVAGGAGLLGTSSGGLLNGVALGGDLLLNTANAYVELAGATTFSTARLAASNTSVRFRPGFVLSSAVVVEGATAGDRYVYVTSNGAGTATIAAGGSVRLLAGSGGDLNISNLSAGTLVNNGLISAEAAGRTLAITNSTLTNNGTLRATAGTLDIRPTNWTNTAGTVNGSGGASINLGGTLDATAGIGTFTTSAAIVNVTGTINNAGNTITLTATTGSFRLAGGAINNGAISTSGGTSLLGTGSGGLLSGVALGGELLLNTANAYAELAGATTFTAARLSANNTSVRFRPGFVLSSAVIAEGAATGDRYVYVTSSGAGTATIASTGSIRLAPGTGADLNISNLNAGTLVNNGTISAEAAGHNITINNSVLTVGATAMMRADNSTLAINTPLGPAGTLTAPGQWQLANGGRLSTSFNANTLDVNLAVAGVGNALTGGLTGTGGLTLLKNQIVFATGAILAIGAGGGTTATNGTLRLSGVVDLATDARLNVTGGLTFAGTAQPIVRAEVASATSMGRLVATGNVDLANPDGGVVRFDVDLIGAYDPAAGTRFNIVTGASVVGDVGAFFGDTTPSGKVLLVGRDNTNLYAFVGTGVPPPAPSITNVNFEYETREAIVFDFNTNVSAFLSRRDLTITNRATNAVVPNAQGRFTYSTDGVQAVFLTSDIPDGNYRLTIQASDISNAAGQPLSTPLTFDFFILRGDANRDRVVNFSDLLIVAQNYGLTGRTFSQGNFDYSSDGLVGFSDLLLLAQQYGKSVPALAQAGVFGSASIAGDATERRDRGIAADILS